MMIFIAFWFSPFIRLQKSGIIQLKLKLFTGFSILWTIAYRKDIFVMQFIIWYPCSSLNSELNYVL